MLATAIIGLRSTRPEGPGMAKQKQEVVLGKRIAHLEPHQHPFVTINTVSRMEGVNEHICSEAILNMFSHEGWYPK